MMRIYLGAEARTGYEPRNPWAQRQFLLGRMAAIDAVRRELWDTGAGPIFPIELTVDNDDEGAPVVRWTDPDHEPLPDLRVSIAHADGFGVAMVGHGVDVGIDIEAIEPRSPRFASMTLTDHEQDLPSPDADPDARLTRLWAAKEAAAKATRRGLGGRPKDFEIEVVDGERYRIGGRWIATERIAGPADPAVPHPTEREEHIVAWTE
jgi:phosphopantetheinyl transferase (holo-ACP synthase)